MEKHYQKARFVKHKDLPPILVGKEIWIEVGPPEYDVVKYHDAPGGGAFKGLLYNAPYFFENNASAVFPQTYLELLPEQHIGDLSESWEAWLLEHTGCRYEELWLARLPSEGEESPC